MAELIRIDQAIKLTTEFEQVSKEIDKKIETANSLVVSEDNYKEVKKIRAELNKEAKMYAEDFKAIKESVLATWNECEDTYKKMIRDKYTESDGILKAKVGEIEDGIKDEKREKIVEFFEKHRASRKLDFVTFDDMNLKIGMSNSLASLKKEVTEKLDEILKGYEGALETSPDVVAEFKENGFDFARAFTTVKDREERKRKAEEERKAMLEARAERERKEAETRALIEETEIKESDEVEEVAEVEQPSTHEEEHETIYSVTFTVRGTRTELMDLSNFLKELNYEYKQIR